MLFRSPAAFGPHRYRQMQEAGITVALGTDSIINLDRADRLSPFDDARLLVSRDHLTPIAALGMLTVAGARALGLPPSSVTFTPGRQVLGCVSIPTPEPGSWSSIFQTDAELELLQ